jgi:hypothetical protein
MRGYVHLESHEVEAGDEILVIPRWLIVESAEGDTLFAIDNDGTETQILRKDIDGAQRWHDDVVDVEGDLQESRMETFDTFDPYDAIPFGDAQAFEDNAVFNDHEGDY